MIKIISIQDHKGVGEVMEKILERILLGSYMAKYPALSLSVTFLSDHIPERTALFLMFVNL